MTIYIGADHGGFNLKEHLKSVLKEQAYEVADVGATAKIDGDDYVDFAKIVGEKVNLAPETDRGILICRSGFGMDIVANKFDHVRAALPSSPDHIYQGRHDDDVNVLCIAADFTEEAMAEKIMKVFISTPFAKEERYGRRLGKIEKIEETN
jgi:ribose 5-phosphate isomerase B